MQTNNPPNQRLQLEVDESTVKTVGGFHSFVLSTQRFYQNLKNKASS